MPTIAGLVAAVGLFNALLCTSARVPCSRPGMLMSAVSIFSPGTQAANFVAEIGKVGQRGITFTQQLHHLSRSGRLLQVEGTLSALKLHDRNLCLRIWQDVSPGWRPKRGCACCAMRVSSPPRPRC